jgi:hypothetical protein
MSGWLRRIRRAPLRSGGAVGVVAVLVGAAGVGISHLERPAAVLASGTQFTISSPSVGPVLYPGAPSSLALTITNNVSAPITVTSLTVSIISPLPSACPASNIQLNGVAFAGSPPHVTLSTSQTISTSAPVSPTPTLMLVDNHVSQDSCKNAGLSFSYSGSANYTVPTTTSLAVAPSPSSVGQSVTLTATVTPNVNPASAASSSPAGTVGFEECTNSGCTTFVSLGTGTLNGSGVATKTTSFAALGSYRLFAVYTPSDSTSFVASASPQTIATVNTVSTSSSLTSSLNPSKFGQLVTLTDTVSSGSGAPAGSVAFFDGTTSIGSATLAGGNATLATSTLSVGTHQISAVYAGDGTHLSSTSNSVAQVVNYTSCVTSTFSGNLTVLAGQVVCITNTGTVGGSVTVNAGGRLDILGGNVSGNLTIQSGGALSFQGGSLAGNLNATGASLVTVYGAKISGNVTVSGSTGFVLIGAAGDDNTPASGPNSISGNLTLSNNTAGAEVGGNTVSGNVSVTGTTGTGSGPENATPEVEANKISGGLACSSNTPAPVNDGHPNTVSGKRSGQCSGAGF